MRFVKRLPILKGWSEDKKYCVTDAAGVRYLLRVSGADRYDAKKREFEMMKQVAKLGVPMCQPIEFGRCEEGVYSILGWIDGEDAKEAIPRFSEDRQYAYGVEAARILREIHSIPAPDTREDWGTFYNRKIDTKIKKYHECSVQYENGQVPILFWRLLALYIASNALASAGWAIPFGREQVDIMVGQAREILRWYDDMKRVIPTWYIPPDDIMIESIRGIYDA